jgi:hypothetical protein
MVAYTVPAWTITFALMSRIRVLSIVGPGRSGTTVLASILGEVDGVATVGELRWLFRRGLLERRPCGCGLPPEECPVWSRVLAEALARRPETAADIAAAQVEVGARRHRIRAIRGGTGRRHDWPALETLCGVSAELLPAIADVTGCRVIVDSSKRAQDAAVLAGLDGIDLYVLHMVRDPRAVVFSWQRRKTIRVAGETRAMATRGLLSSVLRWTENSIGAELLRARVPAERWMFLRYEDFATAPRDAVGRVLEFLGERTDPPFVDERTVVLGGNHTVAGNPNRFRTGPVTVSPDDEWRRAMPRRRQLAVRALTWPFLRRYGFPLAG